MGRSTIPVEFRIPVRVIQIGGKAMRNKTLASVVVTLILAASAWASTETVLYSFASQTGDGYYPYAGLIADKSGNYYGTTYDGGEHSSYGAVFELSPSGSGWTETTLYSFGAAPDGYYPYGGLVMDKTGNLYGATYYGGSSGYGIVYELKHSGSTWTEQILYNFTDTNGDGANPLSQLSFDAKGNLYGTTEHGGKGYGTVYQLKPAKGGKWTESVLYAFAGGATDGYYPQLGALLVAKGGYFYGTTLYGGSSYNAGTVYELFEARGVWVEKVIYAFTGGKAGEYLYDGVAIDKNGTLYGTAYQGGANNYGAVYRLTQAKNKSWTHLTLYSFAAGADDGAYPYGGVTLDAKGDIFGTTYQGGQGNAGSVFELKPSKKAFKETVLYLFGGTGDGYYPHSTPILNSKGDVFGTTTNGGAKSGGIVFEITP
jgi:uncharacterized repeat protein (TIGR03803 family)